MRLSLSCLLASALTVQAAAETPKAPLALTAADREAVVTALGRELRARYVFPDVAAATDTALQKRLAHGAYTDDTTVAKFADDLTRDLRKIAADKHLQVTFDPEFTPPPPSRGLTPQQAFETRGAMSQDAFGIQRVQRLPGNIAYLDIRGFFPAEFSAPAIDSAMRLIDGSDALIIDLRSNHGGFPDGVSYLLSHFFAELDPRHLNDIYDRRDNSMRTYWTVPSASPRYDRPIYVLTSHETFSGGEECAYDLQVQERATLVGETTGGGANPGNLQPIAKGFVAFIPNRRSINPITKTNWEHVGVTPTISVPASEAMHTAYTEALTKLAGSSTDDDERNHLNDVLARLKAGTIDLPYYSPAK